PESTGGLGVDNQLELLRLFHGKVTGLDALQDLVDIYGGPPEQVLVVRCIRDEPTLLCEVLQIEHRRQPAFESQAREPLRVDVEERVLMRENQPLGARLGHGGECAVEFLRPPNLESFEVETQGLRRIPCSATARPGRAIGWVRENCYPRDSGHRLLEQLQ